MTVVECHIGKTNNRQKKRLTVFSVSPTLCYKQCITVNKIQMQTMYNSKQCTTVNIVHVWTFQNWKRCTTVNNVQMQIMKTYK